MAELLGQVARAGPNDARAHAQHLLGAAQRPSAPVAAGRGPEDELSEREREVLRLLASELSGPEIAGHLFVSVNTLRTHTKHIFSKLNVNTRRAAVRRAADLGLL
jgi:LuxR family maltose regulon positive regulatory protein